MSKWNRPMRLYRSYAPKCARCGKQLTAAVNVEGLGYCHAWNCLAPTRRHTAQERAAERTAKGIV